MRITGLGHRLRASQAAPPGQAPTNWATPIPLTGPSAPPSGDA